MSEVFPGEVGSKEYTDAAQSLINMVDDLADQFSHEGTYYGFRELTAPDNPDSVVGLIILKSHTGSMEEPASRISTIELYQPISSTNGLMQEYWVRWDGQRYQAGFEYFNLDSNVGIRAIGGNEFSEMTSNHLLELRNLVEASEQTNHAYIASA